MISYQIGIVKQNGLQSNLRHFQTHSILHKIFYALHQCDWDVSVDKVEMVNMSMKFYILVNAVIIES